MTEKEDRELADSVLEVSISANKENHLSLLSATERWRNPENLELLKQSLCHCMKIMMKTEDNIMFKANSHFVGPFNFNWKIADFNIVDLKRDSYALVWWLRNLYILQTARIYSGTIRQSIWLAVRSRDLLQV